MRNFYINIKAIAMLTGLILVSTSPVKNKTKVISEEKIINDITDNTSQSNKALESISATSDKLESEFKNNGTNAIINNDIETKEITISFAGDCTLGNDKKVTYFNDMVIAQQNDYSYFFKNVSDVFEKDDYTLVNLETTFTDATQYADKQFSATM